EVDAVAVPGEELNHCIGEALILSVSEGRQIRLVHNDKEFLINPTKIVDSIREDYQQPRT
ncbi:unnamed protein product, partial [marine sediment metagenome]